MIPARGGSRGVPRKNVRQLGGHPLIVHVIRAALAQCVPERIIVITDDDEIAAVAAGQGVRIVREPRTTGLATLDDVAMKVAEDIRGWGAADDDIFLTMQATCPFIKPQRISEAVAAFERGAGSVITVVDDRHLGWRRDADGEPTPDYAARLNRQKLPPQYRESGAIIGCRLSDLFARRTRIVAPIALIEVGKEESLDIDDFTDWAVAEHLASRRRILIRADGAPGLGLGHIYRSLAVAQELARHRLTIVTDGGKPLGGQVLAEHPFEVATVDGDAGFLDMVASEAPDLVILDQLDTSAAYVERIRAMAGRVVTFEDQGDGALIADLVVSDLYQNLAVPNERQLTGIGNAILAPSFESIGSPREPGAQIERILVVFGGTDPAHLTERALSALAQIGFSGAIDVVVGPGVSRPIALETYGLKGDVHVNVRYMPALMQQADLAISSAGRTITELLSLGVPVLCLCQNEKELIHTHASAQFGVINLGLGALVAPETIAAHLERLIASPALRSVLRERALHETADRSNAKVIQRMLHALRWA